MMILSVIPIRSLAIYKAGSISQYLTWVYGYSRIGVINQLYQINTVFSSEWVEKIWF